MDAAEPHGTVEAAHDQNHVEVGHQGLFALTAGCPPSQQRVALEGGPWGVVAIQHHPISHDGTRFNRGPEHGPTRWTVGRRHHQPGTVVAHHSAHPGLIDIGRRSRAQEVFVASPPVVVPPICPKWDRGHVVSGSHARRRPSSTLG